MYKNKTRWWIGMAVTLIACMPTGAGESKDEIRAVLSAWGGDRTLLLVRLDLGRVDTDAAFDLAEQTVSKGLAPEPAGQIRAAWQAPRKNAKEAVSSLKAAGARTMYVVWDDTDLFNPVVAIPASAGANEAALKQGVETLFKALHLRDGDWLQVRRAGEVLLMRSKPSLDQYKAPSGPPGPQWDQAMARVTDAAVQVFLAPSEDSRRVLEEMLPVVSGQRIQVPDHVITKGLQWAALDLDWPPRLALRVHIQSTDPGAAQALRQFVTQALAAATQAFGPKTSDPKQDSAIVGLTPEVVNNTLRLGLDTQQATRLLDEGITPALVEAHRWSVKIQCARTLSGLGKAMLLYANDYNDLLPPDLQILIKTQEVPSWMLRCEGEGMGRSAMPYVYRGVDIGGTSASPGLILVHDPRGSHHDGRNVLFVDSHVEWLTEGEFQKRIEEDNRARRQAGLPEKSSE